MECVLLDDGEREREREGEKVRERQGAERTQMHVRQNDNNWGNPRQGYISYIVLFLPLFHRFEKFETEKLRKTSVGEEK